MKNSGGKIFLGVVLVLLGVLFLLDQLGLGRILGGQSLIGYFWPLIIVGIGILFLVRGGLTPGIIFVTFGLLFIASQFFGWSIWGNWWPIVLIAIGVAILLGKTTENVFSNAVSGTTEANTLNDFLIFWGSEKRIVSKAFHGGKITCMFGGEKIDLREAAIAKDGAKLEVYCAFGGVEIIAPVDMNVEVAGNGVLGAVENKAVHNTEANNKPKLLIVGNVAFGGIEVKN